MTILLSKNHRVYYYEGLASDPTKPPDLKVTTFKAKDGIRDEIIAKKQRVTQLQQSGALGAKDLTTMLIKPDTTSTYEDLVNILDEMSINDVRIYAIVDITDVDQGIYRRQQKQANGGVRNKHMSILWNIVP